MKKVKKGVALLLMLVLMATLVVAAHNSWRGADLGDLSQYYETGSVGKSEAEPGYISTVAGDAGGTSYGIYMFSSNAGTPYAFAKWLAAYPKGTMYRSMGDVLVDAYERNRFGEYSPGYGSNFDAKWTEIAEKYHDEFYAAQKEYWLEANYTQLIKNVQAKYSAFDMDNYSIALKNVFWSRSVQHGVSGATTVITNAIGNLGGFKNQSEEALIAAIYAECSKIGTTSSNKMTDAVAYKYGVGGKSMAYYSGNSGSIQISVYRRLHVNEPADAAVMLYQNQNWAVPNGVYEIRERANNQTRAIVAGKIATASSADNFVLTNFESGYVTLSVGDKRLCDNRGTVTMAGADASNSQMWEINGYTLRNRATGGYLAISDSGALITVGEAGRATQWQLSGQNRVLGTGLFYPGCETNLTYKLVARNSSFPLRGVITSAKNITNVTVKVSGSGTGFTASAAPNANWYDLWELDGKCTFSQLSAGSYTMTITAAAGGETTTLAESKFSVSANSGPVVDDERFTVTFDPNGGTCNRKSKTYELGDVYGFLPIARRSGYNFVGWFMEDGTPVSPFTPVAAGSHTLVAKYGDLYTVKFLKPDGSTLKTLQLAKGELITAPTSPVKAADSSYTYSFAYWQDASGNQFVGGETYMGSADITYTPVFNKTEIGAGGSGTGTPGSTPGGATSDGGYLKGIVPQTEISTLSGSGYTVYDSGGTQVSSGSLATGMIAVSGKTQVTVVVTGDANGDGKLTITDVVKLQAHVVGKNTLSGAYAKAADLNGDGSITITDVVQAAQITVGKRSLS